MGWFNRNKNKDRGARERDEHGWLLPATPEEEALYHEGIAKVAIALERADRREFEEWDGRFESVRRVPPRNVPPRNGTG